MAYLVGKTSIDIINDEAVDIRNKIPIGVYKLDVAQMRGFYLEKTDYKTDHGKIYGKSEQIANHVVTAFEMMKDRNLGVLFSGGKGLGKSLTSRLIVEKLKDTYPIIIIDNFIKGMFDFLAPISNAVFIFDEFEKVMNGNADGSDNNTKTITKQEEMLSFLDGIKDGSHNLIIMTANEKHKINENFISRPGRIMYHYKFESCDEETIRKYCADNLQKPELENDIVDSLLSTRYVSLDIVRALVEEINNYDVSVDNALAYLNIEMERISLGCNIKYYSRDGSHIKTFTAYPGAYHNGMKRLCFDDFMCYDGKEATDEGKFLANIEVDMKGVRIPLIGEIDVSSRATVTFDEQSEYEPKIISIALFDENVSPPGKKIGSY